MGHAHQPERIALVMLGDFNRRLALTDDWGWTVLSPLPKPVLLPTEGVPFRCDPRYPVFIDHLVARGGAEAMLVDGSLREWPRRGPRPDHYAVPALFQIGGRRPRSSSDRVQPRLTEASMRRL